MKIEITEGRYGIEVRTSTGGKYGTLTSEVQHPDASPDAKTLAVTMLHQALALLDPGHRLRWGAIPGVCRQCQGECEEERACYAVPVCYACLPPPPPLETISGE